MTSRFNPVILSFSLLASSMVSQGVLRASEVLIDDAFQRDEAVAGEEGIGNGWGTNSRSRAKGNQQVDLIDGVMHITRHPVADHGVSVTHAAEFADATIELKFQLGLKDDIGINIADPKEKSVHAGHLCMTRVQLKKVEILDLKTGRMDSEARTARLENRLTQEQKENIQTKSEIFSVDLEPSVWHQLKVSIIGDSMSVEIDGESVGQFASPGIAHPTKRLLRIAVNRNALVDDVKVTRLR